MRFKNPRLLVGAVTALAMSASLVPMFATTANAAAPKKPVVKDCAYFGDTQRATASIGRDGLTQTSGSSEVLITLNGTSVVFAPQGDYTVTGFVIDNVYTMVDPQAVYGDTVSGTNPYKKGRAKNVYACGNYNAPVVTDSEIDFAYAADGSVVVTYVMVGDLEVELTYVYNWRNLDDPTSDVFDGAYTLLPPAAGASTRIFYASPGDHISGDLRVGSTLVDAFTCVVGTDCPAPTP
jgi:hypothetical protein